MLVYYRADCRSTGRTGDTCSPYLSSTTRTTLWPLGTDGSIFRTLRGCGSERQERGLLSPQATGGGSREEVLPPRVEQARRSTLDYAGCLCGFAPGRAGVEEERRDSQSEDAGSVMRLPE